MRDAQKMAGLLKNDVYIFGAVFLFSGYQMTRLSSLSSSGKKMAPIGLGLSALALFNVKMA